jgi:hypothetical protein
MRLKLGIWGIQPGYEIILEQIGVPYENVSENTNITLENYSVIIISEIIQESDKQVILEYMNTGGSVLLNARCWANLYGKKLKQKKVRFLISDNNSIYSSLGLVDIYTKISYVNSKELGILDEGLGIYHTKIGKGFVLIFPFDINSLILDTRSIRKRFYSERKELPSEIVARVSKGKLRELVRISLGSLHHKRGLPFVHKWYFPDSSENVFIFRLDTDFCSSHQANNMVGICRKNNISATWFLDTTSEERLHNYAEMKDQELALHCDRHLVFSDYKNNKKNLEIGRDKLNATGIEMNGFAAPFGDWNPELAKVLDDLNLEYSSEFTLDYDDLPFNPFINGKFSKVLQIPIHPISLGWLRRSHFSPKEMLNYYLKLIDEKLYLYEPTIIYHHPHHEYLNILDKVFQYVNKIKVKKLTMNEYAKWWKMRTNTQPDLYFEDNRLRSNIESNDISLRITLEEGSIITKFNKMIDLANLRFIKQKKVEHQHDLKRLRKWCWRDILYNYESIRGKKKK